MCQDGRSDQYSVVIEETVGLKAVILDSLSAVMGYFAAGASQRKRIIKILDK